MQGTFTRQATKKQFPQEVEQEQYTHVWNLHLDERTIRCRTYPKTVGRDIQEATAVRYRHVFRRRSRWHRGGREYDSLPKTDPRVVAMGEENVVNETPDNMYLPNRHDAIGSRTTNESRKCKIAVVRKPNSTHSLTQEHSSRQMPHFLRRSIAFC